MDPRFKQYELHDDDVLKQTKENILSKCIQIRDREKLIHESPIDSIQNQPSTSTRPSTSTETEIAIETLSKPKSIWSDFDSMYC